MPGGRSVKCSGAALPRGESGREARLLYLAVDVLSSGRCVVYREPSGPSGVRIEERPRSPLREGAVTVSMKAASLNHLDLWLVGGAQRVEPPRVLGADGAGVVAESGDPRWKPGDEVVLYPVSCCWQCEQCLAGRQAFCGRFGIFCVPVQEGGGGGVGVVFEHVGPATLDESIRSIKKGGRIVFCGSTSGVKAEVNMPRLFFGQADLLGSTMGNAGEFEQVLEAIGRGLRPIVDSTFALDEATSALERLERAEQFGKVVLHP